MSGSGQNTLDKISEYMLPFRAAAEMEKVAAEQSYQDSSSNNVSGNDKKNATDTQTNLGKEQSSDAKDGGSTVEDESDNNDSLGELPTDNQGTVTMDVDQELTQNGNIGTIQTQEISQTQKTASEQARVSNLANAVIARLDVAPVQKTASVARTASAAGQCPLEKQASEAAYKYGQSYLAGLQARQRDQTSLEKNAAFKLQIDAAGGAGALLDKLAMEDPSAVLPPEAMAEMPMDPSMGEDPMAEMPMDPSMGEAPMEAPMGGEAPSDDQLQQVAEELAAEGVSPEDIEKALADLQEMQAAGVNPEDLAQALSEMEGGAEAPVDMAEAGGEVEKVASAGNREDVDAIKAYILNR